MERGNQMIPGRLRKHAALEVDERCALVKWEDTPSRRTATVWPRLRRTIGLHQSGCVRRPGAKLGHA